MDKSSAATTKSTNRSAEPNAAKAAAPNFIRHIVAEDLERGTYADRRWAGRPGPYDIHAAAPADPARIRTRFPPEPNGYLHIGHSKSIFLNFGLARDFGGRCHMRFDDTNPVKEDQEFVDGILDSVRWLGFRWEHEGESNLYHASDYFEDMYRFAEHLVLNGYAYVDQQSADEMRASRGTLTQPGIDSPFRNRPIEENLRLLREMRAGLHAEGSMVLRAKIDMASPNINMRDPAIYRIRYAEHHMTGKSWVIYPMYSYAHPIEDALENITHSICTLEFEDQRPFYDWVLERIVPLLRAPQYERARSLLKALAAEDLQARRQFALRCLSFKEKLGQSRYEQRAAAMFGAWEANQAAVGGDADEFLKLLISQAQCFTPLLQSALADRLPNPFMLPHQHEFNRLNLTYVVMSKRKLIQLVDEKRVDGWDDPRMPTLVGLRRRGYTPEALQLFIDRIGVSKSTQWIDYAVLEQALRDDLDARAPRATAVLRPLRLVIDNYPVGQAEPCEVPVHPQRPELGRRLLNFARELWIEREDFMEAAPKDYFRLYPGSMVRLRYAYVIRCTGFDRSDDGEVSTVHAELVPDTKSGTPGASAVKVKGAIHWLPAQDSVPAEIRLYDRLFVAPQPDAASQDFITLLNPSSKTVLQSYVEAALAQAQPDEKFQFERNGYFVADRKDHRSERPVFNLAVSLKDSWNKG